jgi:LysM repeat protein
MRHLLASLSVASLLIALGCGEERVSMMVVPDRQDHAYSDNGSTGGGVGMNVPIPTKSEIFITTGPKDTLTSVAAKYRTTISWLIHRNDLKNGLPPVGSNLIVPNPNYQEGAAAPAPAPGPAPLPPAR